MALSNQELAVLVKITGDYETSGQGYGMVAGNFDGQGISCGVLQWNIGQTSLQPMVIAVGQARVQTLMPVHGTALWQACHASIGQALAIVRGWQNGNTLKAVPKQELRALMTSAEMKAQQDKYIRIIATAAEAEADAWAAARGGPPRTLQEMALFFDIATQNHTSAGVTHAVVRQFIAAATPGTADDLVCDWMRDYNTAVAGYGDGAKNVALWRNAAQGAALDLLVLGYLRANKSNRRWRIDVMNRKGTIAMRRGWVHQSSLDYSAVF